jgi:tetratricopeptide (TPR) repeat protein
VLYPFRRTSVLRAAAPAAAALAAVTALFLWQVRRRPYLVVGWLWYLGMLVPVIGLVQVGRQAYADRYTYLPTVGLLIALSWLVGELVARSRPRRAVAVGAAVAALAVLSALTVRQVPLWKDTRTLFSHALAVTHDNPVAHEELGEALLQEGQAQLAVPQFEEALRLLPGYPEAHANLGGALGVLGRYDEAIAHFRVALRSLDEPETRQNLAYTLAQLGRMDEAIPEYEAALRLDPGLPFAHLLLGKALATSGRLADAEQHLRRALESKPADLEARRTLATVLEREGRIEDAIREYGEILRQSPDDVDAARQLEKHRAGKPYHPGE